MEKEICVLLTDYTKGDSLFSEKLRMAVGLTINDDLSVKALFLGNARRALEETDKAAAGTAEIKKHIETLSMMHAEILVEEGGEYSVLP
ncbi:MAG: hypothetical protein V3S46_04850, partial [Nitrospinota bacterium]